MNALEINNFIQEYKKSPRVFIVYLKSGSVLPGEAPELVKNSFVFQCYIIKSASKRELIRSIADTYKNRALDVLKNSVSINSILKIDLTNTLTV